MLWSTSGQKRGEGRYEISDSRIYLTQLKSPSAENEGYTSAEE